MVCRESLLEPDIVNKVLVAHPVDASLESDEPTWMRALHGARSRAVQDPPSNQRQARSTASEEQQPPNDLADPPIIGVKGSGGCALALTTRVRECSRPAAVREVCSACVSTPGARGQLILHTDGPEGDGPVVEEDREEELVFADFLRVVQDELGAASRRVLELKMADAKLNDEDIADHVGIAPLGVVAIMNAVARLYREYSLAAA